MISVRLAGGLGNQIFQIAAAIHLRRKGVPILLLTDALSHYDVVRQPDLLRIIDTAALDVSISRSNSVLGRFQILSRAGRWLPYFGINDGNVKEKCAGSVGFGWFDGYFQDFWSSASFGEISEILRSVLLIPRLSGAKAVDFAIHIRGGDFLQDPNLAVVSMSWYADRLREAANSDNIDRAHVITDDPVHANQMLRRLRDALPSISFEVVCSENSIDDFNLLRCARRRVISNSTFALWASALDELAAPTICPIMLGKGRPRQSCLPWELMR